MCKCSSKSWIEIDRSIMETILKEPSEELRQKIMDISGEDYYHCFQCGTCTSGCPAAGQMDILPNQINMLLQLGEFKRVLESQTIWTCVACFECGERCPKGVRICKINEALRQIKIRKNIDRYNIWEKATTGEYPTIVLVASFRKFTA